MPNIILCDTVSLGPSTIGPSTIPSHTFSTFSRCLIYPFHLFLAISGFTRNKLPLSSLKQFTPTTSYLSFANSCSILNTDLYPFSILRFSPNFFLCLFCNLLCQIIFCQCIFTRDSVVWWVFPWLSPITCLYHHTFYRPPTTISLETFFVHFYLSASIWSSFLIWIYPTGRWSHLSISNPVTSLFLSLLNCVPHTHNHLHLISNSKILCIYCSKDKTSMHSIIPISCSTCPFKSPLKTTISTFFSLSTKSYTIFQNVSSTFTILVFPPFHCVSCTQHTSTLHHSRCSTTLSHLPVIFPEFHEPYLQLRVPQEKLGSLPSYLGFLSSTCPLGATSSVLTKGNANPHILLWGFTISILVHRCD